MIVRVDVQFASGQAPTLTAEDIAAWVGRAAETVGDGESEISVRVVDAAEMQQMNSEYRGKDSPTNVLSFPAGEIDGLPAGTDKPLGDLVVCASVVNDEAATQGKGLEDHWAHMIVHGTLHLLGFDHETDAEAAVMENREIEVLGAYGITNPYVDSIKESPIET